MCCHSENEVHEASSCSKDTEHASQEVAIADKPVWVGTIGEYVGDLSEEVCLNGRYSSGAQNANDGDTVQNPVVALLVEASAGGMETVAGQAYGFADVAPATASISAEGANVSVTGADEKGGCGAWS